MSTQSETSADLYNLVRERTSEIAELCKRHGAYDIRVFGSVVRGDSHIESDIDFLINAHEKTSAWFPGSLKVDLEDLLGRKVDVVMEEGLRSELRDSILDEAVWLNEM